MKYYDEDNFTKLTEFKLPKSNKLIKLRMQTPRMIDDVNSRANEIRKKTRNQGGDPAFSLTIQSLIDTVDGQKLDAIKKEDFVLKLPMMDTNYIIKHAQKLVESFGLNNTISNTCSVCGLDYKSNFRITSEFFGPSIDF